MYIILNVYVKVSFQKIFNPALGRNSLTHVRSWLGREATVATAASSPLKSVVSNSRKLLVKDHTTYIVLNKLLVYPAQHWDHSYNQIFRSPVEIRANSSMAALAQIK